MIWLLTALIALLLAGFAYEQVASAAVRRRNPPPGRLVDVGGRRLHLHATGTAEGPTVVIEAGRFNTALMETLVQAGIAPFARVCTYDRAGYGWSDPDRAPRTGERVSADLHRLLQQAEIPGPYLLVGHSLGAMYVRCFAQRYPEEVAGLVLVDPLTEGEVLGWSRRDKAMQARSCRVLRWISRFGLVRLMLPFLRGVAAHFARFEPAVRAQILALTCDYRLLQAVDQEWQQVDRMIACELGGPGSLGNLPLVVLRAGRCELEGNPAEVAERWALIKGAQGAMTALSLQGQVVNVPDSGHGVPLERPEAVVGAVRRMLQGAGGPVGLG